MTRRPGQFRGRGFTLVEVLATLALIAIVLPVAMQAVTSSSEAALRARNIAQAATLADGKLNEVLAMQELATTGNSGDFGREFEGFRWEMQTFARDYNLTEVIVGVGWEERGQLHWQYVSTFVYSQETGSLP